MTSTSSNQLTVIFDGTCGFCTATVRQLRQRDRHQRIKWLPCQQIADSDKIRRLCEQTVVSVTTDGTVDTGAQAFARILGTIADSTLPVRIARLPVLSPLLSLGYKGIARIRGHLPGDRPWCDQYPDDCKPGNTS